MHLSPHYLLLPHLSVGDMHASAGKQKSPDPSLLGQTQKIAPAIYYGSCRDNPLCFPLFGCITLILDSGNWVTEVCRNKSISCCS
jgi:hypothetical protein